MEHREWLARQFENNRTHLRAVAYRMLGSVSEAEDAVQEAWLRLSRADTGEVANFGGWLTTATARICLDMLRSRESRREEPLDAQAHEPLMTHDERHDPEQQAVLADSVGLALLVVLDTLNPAERLAFVLHDLFGVPFEEIAPIVGRSPDAARQLASRARRRVRRRVRQQRGDAVGADTGTDLSRQRAVVNAFLAAARGGDFDALLALLDPAVALRADQAAVAAGATTDVHGADAVARQFAGRARVAQAALIDGVAGAVWAPGGQPRVVFNFTIKSGKIRAIEIVADPARLASLALTILGD